MERAVFDGVTAIKVGRLPWLKYAGRPSNTMVWFFQAGNLLIDSGTPPTWSVVKKFVTERADSPMPIKRVCVTHHHEDHAGNALRLQKELNLPVYAPALSADLIRDGFRIEWYREMIWGSIKPGCKIIPLPDRLPFKLPQNESATLVPVAAPGHCFDHTVFHVPEKRWLFSADLLVTRKPVILRFDEDILLNMRTIENVLKLDFTTVFCGHKGVVKDGHAALTARLEWLTKLHYEVHRLNMKGLSASQIALKLLGKEDTLATISNGDFSRLHMVQGLLKEPPEMADDEP